MLDLGLSILFSSLIFVLFKLFSIYKVQTFYAIITNYIVAFSVGLAVYQEQIEISSIPEKPWFLGAIALGLLFIVVFNLMATTTQKAGVSVTSVATKMSFVIPVLIGVIAYKEKLDFIKVFAIFLAIASVYFTSTKESNTALNRKNLILPILVFLGSGTIDACINYFQEFHVTPIEFSLFSSMVFGFAALTGMLFILVQLKNKPLKLNLKNCIAGIVLGVPNYFSIYFLLRALNNPNINSASIFTINNVAIVMLSTFLGILLFKEKMTKVNWIGVVTAIISISLFTLT